MLAATAVLLLLQPMTTVHGVVRVESTLEPVTHAVVRIPALGRRAAVDERGYFVLAELPAGRWSFRVSALGYRTAEFEVSVPAEGAVRLDFDLALDPVQLPEIEVSAEARAAAAAEGAGPPPIRVDGPALSIAPGLFEADVFRALQLLPAVAAASDFSSALYVRGGSPDQSLILLDGMPLFNPFHAGGLFAAFDPAAIAEVDILPGAFPAAAGDRLSSVVSVRTRDGGRDRIRGQGAIGLASSRVGLDGPLPGSRGSYLVSVRRTYLDLLTDAADALGLINGTLPYSFTDAHLKVTHDVGGLGSVAASFYVDQEDLDVPDESPDPDEPEQRFDWGSYAASLQYRQPFGATLLAEFRAAVSTFSGSFEAWERRWGLSTADPEWVRAFHAGSETRDLVAGADFTWHAHPHRLGWGIQLDHYLFEHEVLPSGQDFEDFLPAFRLSDRPATLSAYVEDEWSLVQRVRLRAGVRVLDAGHLGTEWMPRFGARVAVSPGLAFTLGAGRYAQVMHSLRDEEAFASTLIAYDLLSTVPAGIGLSTAEDVVLGVDWRRGATTLRVDGYLKRMERLPLPGVQPAGIEAPVLVVAGRRAGSGSARGVEVLLRHARGRTHFSLGYALSSTELEVDGVRYPPHYDRRHTLDVTAAAPLGERGLLSARLAWASGQPYTRVVGIAETFLYDPHSGTFSAPYEGEALLMGAHNGARLPSYFRLDVAVKKSFEKRWFGAAVTLTPYFQILNLLNTRNVLYALPDTDDVFGRRATAETEYLPQLPFLPTFGLEWRF